ncbi:MAG: NYN domain-containing protein [Tissierellia bacterium]|nr:NYN domain-containing protein [Tissierellia bacterium]
MARQKELLMVDGYNIINSWTSLEDSKEQSLEEARDKLIHILAEYAHYSNYEITVVFDAYKVKGRYTNEETLRGINVVFTEELMTADQYIEQYLDRYGRERRIRVATSDRIEQEVILSRGGIRVSARELEAEIEDRFAEAKRKQKITNIKNNYHITFREEKWKDTLKKAMKKKIRE